MSVMRVHREVFSMCVVTSRKTTRVDPCRMACCMPIHTILRWGWEPGAPSYTRRLTMIGIAEIGFPSCTFCTDLENLLAANHANPMIVVMPNGHITTADQPEPKPAELSRVFGQDLVRDLIPLIDSSYRTLPSRQGRAVAGLSMGAYQAMWFAMDHPHLVSALGVFSGGIFMPASEGEADIIRYATSPAALKHPLGVFRIAIGDRDMNLPLSKKLDSLLTTHNVKHEFQISPGAGHTWPFWRKCLSETLPLLFRNTR